MSAALLALHVFKQIEFSLLYKAYAKQILALLLHTPYICSDDKHPAANPLESMGSSLGSSDSSSSLLPPSFSSCGVGRAPGALLAAMG